MAMAVSGSVSVVTGSDRCRHPEPVDGQPPTSASITWGRPGKRSHDEREDPPLDEPVAVVDLERSTDERDRHVGADDLVAPDDHEVDVRDRLGDGVALHLAAMVR